MIRIHTFFFLLTVMTFSCSAPQMKEQPEHFIADFFVRYLEAEKQLKANANFFIGDSIRTAHPVDVNGGVFFQGKIMGKRELPDHGARYAVTRTSEFEERFLFTYRDNRDRSQELLITMSPVGNFSISGAPSKSGGLTLQVENGKLSAGETLILFFSDAGDKAMTITFNGPISDPAYSLSPQELAGLPAGPTQLYLVKKAANIQTRDGQTQISTIEYYTGALGFTLLP